MLSVDCDMGIIKNRIEFNVMLPGPLSKTALDGVVVFYGHAQIL